MSKSLFYQDDRRPPTISEMRAVESKLNVTLPDYLKTLYHVGNGGRIERHLYRTENDYDSCMPDGLLCLEGFITLLDADEDKFFTNHFENNKKLKQQYPDTQKLIVIARYGYELFTCLDYNHTESNEPSVIVLNVMNRPKIVYMAENTRDFFTNLKTEDEMLLTKE